MYEVFQVFLVVCYINTNCLNLVTVQCAFLVHDSILTLSRFFSKKREIFIHFAEVSIFDWDMALGHREFGFLSSFVRSPCVSVYVNTYFKHTYLLSVVVIYFVHNFVTNPTTIQVLSLLL